MSTVLRLDQASRLFYGADEVSRLYRGSTKLWPGRPRVIARAKGTSPTSNLTTYSPPMPSGITAGKLLLAAIAADGNGTMTDDSGLWTKLGQISSSSLVTSIVFWKIATGSDVLNVTNTTSEQFSSMAWCIANANTVTGTGLAGSATANANPPSHTFPDGLKEALAIAFASHDGSTVASAGPAVYGNFDAQIGGSAGASISAAELSVSASSEDPGAFTSAAVRHAMYTLAIYQN